MARDEDVTALHHGNTTDAQRAWARNKQVSGPEWDCNNCTAQPKTEAAT